MSDDPPTWFGEAHEEPASSIDPPSVPVDWFGDIESDDFPTRTGSTRATEADEATHGEATESVVDQTAAAAAESIQAEPEPTEPAATSETEVTETSHKSASEMDGTREATAEELGTNADDRSDGGFVAWLKSLFGLG